MFRRRSGPEEVSAALPRRTPVEAQQRARETGTGTLHCAVERQEHTTSRGLGLEAGPMLAAGLGSDDIIRLLRLKRRIEAGEVGEQTLEYKRLLFVKCLVASGRIHD